VDDDSIRVIRGEPTPEELAALVTVLAAHAAASTTAPVAAPVSRWAASARPRGNRVGGSHGPDAWRASALPR
jgi:hypothetical protein